MRTPRIIGLVLSALVLCTATSALAARLQIIEQSIDKQLPPAMNQVDPPLQLSSELTPEVGAAEFFASFGIVHTLTARTSDANCTGTFPASFFSATIVVTLLPGPGESEGDPVAVCFNESFTQRATASAGWTSTSTIGGLLGVGPNTIIVNPGDVDERVIHSFGPNTVDQAEGAEVHAFGHAFTANIGDIIELRVGARLAISCDGAGDGLASHLTFVELRTNGCSTNAPTASYGGLAALALLLVTLGLVALRRREHRLR